MTTLINPVREPTTNLAGSVFERAKAIFMLYAQPMKLDEKYPGRGVLERMTTPDKAVSFRLSLEMDDGTVRSFKAYRVQFNDDLGPYKGGLRFHPSVTEDDLFDAVMIGVDKQLVDDSGDTAAWPLLLAGDKGYRADWIDTYLLDLGITPVIPSKENEDREARPVAFDKEACH